MEKIFNAITDNTHDRETIFQNGAIDYFTAVSVISHISKACIDVKQITELLENSLKEAIEHLIERMLKHGVFVRREDGTLAITDPIPGDLIGMYLTPIKHVHWRPEK